MEGAAKLSDSEVLQNVFRFQHPSHGHDPVIDHQRRGAHDTVFHDPGHIGDVLDLSPDLVLLYAMLQGNRSFQEKIRVMPGRCAILAAAPTCPAFSLSGGGVAGAALAMLLPLMYPGGVEPDYLETFDVLRLIPESGYPPLIITTTPADELLYEENLILEKALAESGRPYRFCSWPEKANKLGHVFNVLFPELEESVEANRAILDFFRARG